MRHLSSRTARNFLESLGCGRSGGGWDHAADSKCQAGQALSLAWSSALSVQRLCRPAERLGVSCRGTRGQPWARWQAGAGSLGRLDRQAQARWEARLGSLGGVWQGLRSHAQGQSRLARRGCRRQRRAGGRQARWAGRRQAGSPRWSSSCLVCLCSRRVCARVSVLVVVVCVCLCSVLVCVCWQAKLVGRKS